MQKGLMALLSLSALLSLFVSPPAEAKRFYGCDSWSGYWIGHHRNHSDWDIGRVRPYRDFSVGGCGIRTRSSDAALGYVLNTGHPAFDQFYGPQPNFLSRAGMNFWF